MIIEVSDIFIGIIIETSENEIQKEFTNFDDAIEYLEFTKRRFGKPIDEVMK